MRTATAALINFLNSARVGDAPIAFADCFTITLPSGQALTYTNVDQSITYQGITYSATGPLVQGLKYKCSVGLDVDKQQITIAARPTDTISGGMFLNALREGAFDGATIQRDRLFMSALGEEPVGIVTLFYGRISTVDQVGRTSAKVTVASCLITLDYKMPVNIYSATCIHTLYDAGCTLNRAAYTSTGNVGASPSTTLIPWSGALAGHSQGSILFTSGTNVDVRATVKSVIPGTSLTLIYPLPSAPAAGDSFTATYGCDHTPVTCRARFNNFANFRGFPYVPPPQTAY